MDEEFESLSPGWQLFKLSERSNVPLAMTVELTRRCHLHCAHCYLNETQTANTPDKLRRMRAAELSAVEWRGVFEQLAEAGGMYLVLSGGEVFLRPDFLDIARFARDLSFNVRVFSTAMHVDDAKACRLAEIGIERMEISLYGGREAHSRVTLSDSAFDRSLLGIQALRRAGVRVTVKAPIMTLNVEERHWLLDFAEENGVLCKFDPTVVPRNDGNKDTLDLRLSVEKLEEVFSDPRMTTEENLDSAASFQSGDYEDFLCSAGRNAGGMDPYGNVYPCLQWLKVCGNVRETPFRDIWRDSPALKEIRGMKHVAENGSGSCATGSYCNNCPGLAELENGDPLQATVFDKLMQDQARTAKSLWEGRKDGEREEKALSGT